MGLPETPCVVVDRAVMERNLQALQTYCDSHQLGFRPHIKTHKTLEIAARQLELGARGLTCQKLGEVEALLPIGARDVMVSYNLLGEAKLERLARLAGATSMSVTVDDRQVAEAMSSTLAHLGVSVGVWVDCDSGLGRTGVQSAEAALTLASRVSELPGLELRGLFTYPTPAPDSWFEEVLGAWRQRFPEPEVSVGGTPGAFETHSRGYATELRAGTYVFMDLNCVRAAVATFADCALTVHATCVSRPTADRAIVDAGSKALGQDRVDLGAGLVYGALKDRPGVAVTSVYEEHGLLTSSDHSQLPQLGERVEIVPTHCCYTVNLHDQLWVSAPGTALESWRVAARGRVA